LRFLLGFSPVLSDRSPLVVFLLHFMLAMSSDLVFFFLKQLDCPDLNISYSSLGLLANMSNGTYNLLCGAHTNDNVLAILLDLIGLSSTLNQINLNASNEC
jgi:uncharacterized membrane protein